MSLIMRQLESRRIEVRSQLLICRQTGKVGSGTRLEGKFSGIGSRPRMEAHKGSSGPAVISLTGAFLVELILASGRRSEHHSAFHYEDDVLHRLDVGQRVTRNSDYVSVLSRLQGADLV